MQGLFLGVNMYCLYQDINHPLCRINSKLKVFPLKGVGLDESRKNAINLMIDQVKRGINPKAEFLRCVDLESSQVTTLGELVSKIKSNKLDFMNPIHRKRIDRYRVAGLTEKQVAMEMKTNEKMLYRHYPRRNSVSTSSTGRML